MTCWGQVPGLRRDIQAYILGLAMKKEVDVDQVDVEDWEMEGLWWALGSVRSHGQMEIRDSLLC